MRFIKRFVRIGFLLVFLVAFLCTCGVKRTNLRPENNRVSALNNLSEDFLKAVRSNQDPKPFLEKIAQLEMEELGTTLRNDAQRYAFWINLYNAYILVVLREKPNLYKDRNSFFSEDRLEIAGNRVSFETIEHGILRKSQWGLGLGYIRKWFPGEFERKLRVEQRDYRIHFALNCGAKDCPPVAVYTPEHLEVQLEKSTQNYLERSTRFDAATNTVYISSLFSWFRGDFGGKSGTRKILNTLGFIPDKKGVEIQYTNYDWTLDLDNFIDL